MDNKLKSNYLEFKIILAYILILYYKSVLIFKKYIKIHKQFNKPIIQNYVYYFHNELNNILKLFNISINLYESINILYLLIQNHKHIIKIINYFDFLGNDCKLGLIQTGGFFYNKYDSIFTKILNIIDIIIDVITIIPNHVIFNSIYHIMGPWQLMAMISNLIRGDYLLAFYSFITLIPGIGSIMGSSLKIIHRIVLFILEKLYVAKQDIFLQDIEAMRRIYKITDFDPLNKYIPYENLNSIENEDLLI